MTPSVQVGAALLVEAAAVVVERIGVMETGVTESGRVTDGAGAVMLGAGVLEIWEVAWEELVALEDAIEVANVVEVGFTELLCELIIEEDEG